eukprot:TRINITY_DN14056_c0_g1_i2.p1 TRINITY_DN14056_c0_g1~~TRINITY_DN14056_c0_g1_i2.p1  ORF type:complete len:300 (+),score=14.07 TRINITY_DN14056_c0_g1_i2:73-972(+)
MHNQEGFAPAEENANGNQSFVRVEGNPSLVLNIFLRSPLYNWTCILVSALKIIVTAIMFSHSRGECQLWAIDGWLWGMILQDSLNILSHLLIRLEETLEVSYALNREQNPAHSQNSNRQLQEAQGRLNFLNEVVKFLTTCVLTLYLCLFITGHVILFSKNNCHDTVPGKVRLITIYTMLGYLYIFGFCCCIFCLTCFIAIYLSFIVITRTNQSRPAPEQVIASLPREPYSRERFPEHSECIICRSPYEPGDEVMRMRCHPSHYFHVECIRSWLLIRGTCPVCRVRVDRASEESQPLVNP